MNKIVTILTTGLLFIATSVFSQLTFTVSPQPISGNVGDQVTLDITVTNFQDILTAQFSLAFDPNILQIVSVDNPDMFPGLNTNANISTSQPNGAIAVAWFDSDAAGVTQPDGTRFFTATFDIIGSVGADTRLLFSTSPTPFEAVTGAGDELSIGSGQVVFDDGTVGGAIGGGTTGTTGGTTGTTGGTTGTTGGTTGTTGGTTGTTGGTTGTTGGTTGTTGGTTGTTGGATTGGATTGGGTTGGTVVTCQPPSSGFAIIGSAETGNVGDVVCVKVSAQDFTNVLSMQYSMNWDPAVLEYSSVGGFGLNGLAAANFNQTTGNLAIAWPDPDATGLTVADGVTLYEVCFTVLSAGTQEMTFSGSPVPIEVVNSSGQELAFQSCPATVSPPSGGGTTGGGTTGGGTTGGNTTGGTVSTCDPPSSGFAILGSVATGNVGDVVCVQVSAQEFTNVLSMQYSMNWDPAVLQYSSVGNFGLSGLGAANFNQTTGSLALAWPDPDATGVTIADGVTLYEVCFTILSAGVQEMTFSGSPVPIEVVNNAGQELTFQSCPAVVGPPGGTTTGSTNGGGMDCEPPASGFAIIGSAEKGNVGDVVCVQVTGQDFDNIISMQYSMAWDQSVLQYSSVQNFGLSGLGASNFNQSGGELGLAWSDPVAIGVSVADGDVLYEVCFTVLAEGTQSINFTNSPVPVEVVNSQGMELVFENCPATISPDDTPPLPDFAIIAGDQMVRQNESICIPVTANGFENIVSMQYSMNWDPAVLTFTGVNVSGNLAGLANANFSSNSPGNLGIAWVDPDASGKTLADGTMLYEVCFTANSTAPVGTSTVSFSSSPVDAEIRTGDNQEVPFNNSDATVTIQEAIQDDPVSVSGSSLSGEPGTNVCMPIIVQDFSDIIGLQFSLSWDPAVLQYSGTQNYGLPGLTAAQFGDTQTGSGILQFAWIDMGSQGVTLADGTIAFEVCFDIIGESGASSTVDFTNTPTQIEVVRLGVGTIPLSPTGGSIAIPAIECAAISVQPNTVSSTCGGFSNGFIELNPGGGDGVFNYTWSDASIGNISNPSNLGPGSYSVTITSCGGQAVLDNLPAFTITEPSPIAVTIQVQDASCTPNGRINVGVSGGSGGYIYQWNSNALLPASGPENVSAGTYRLTVTDNTGCSTEVSNVVVNQIGGSNLSVTQNVTAASCSGRADGQVELMVNGTVTGLICDWGGNGIFGCTPTNVPAGSYTVNVRDAGGGCETAVNIVVGNSKVLSVSSSVTADICANNEGKIDVFPVGGTEPYFYQWVGTASIPNTANAMGIPRGTYNVTVNDASGCTITIPDIQVGGAEAPVSITPTSQTNTECADDPTGAIAILARGGTEPYNYQWENEAGESVTGDRVITSLSAGVYAVTVTDVNSCTSQQSYTIAANSMLDATVEVVGLAPDAVATVTPTGGAEPYEIIWCNGGDSLVVDNLSPGNCNVMVMDDRGCAIVRTFEVAAPSLSVTSISSTGITCPGENDAVLTANAAGGRQPYNYLWSNGAISQVIVNAIPNEYTVTITDANGETATSTFDLVDATEINIELADMKQVCDSDGRLAINISNGAAPYQVAWSTGTMNRTEIDSLRVGEYGVIITDENDCTASKTFPLTSDPQCEDCFTAIPVITPNEDGRNDAFRINCANTTKGNVLRIFNRWGQLVYETEGYSCVLGTEGDCWKGTNQNNRDLPKGGYFWVLEYEQDGQRARIRDHITILRE